MHVFSPDCSDMPMRMRIGAAMGMVNCPVLYTAYLIRHFFPYITTSSLSLFISPWYWTQGDYRLSMGRTGNINVAIISVSRELVCCTISSSIGISLLLTICNIVSNFPQVCSASSSNTSGK